MWLRSVRSGLVALATRAIGVASAQEAPPEALPDPWADAAELAPAAAESSPAAGGDPAAPSPDEAVGVLYLNDGRYREAARAFDRAITTDGETPRLRSRAGVAWLLEGEHPRAVWAFKRATLLEPDAAEHALRLAHAYRAAHMRPAAERSYRRVVALDSTNTEAHGALAALAGEAAPAEGTGASVMGASDPTGPEAAELLASALAHVELGDYVDAKRAATSAIALVPMDAGAWRLLGRARLGVGEVDGAAGAFAESTRLDPRDVLAWRLLGDARCAGGDTAAAMAAYSRALKLDSSDARARAGWDRVAGVRSLTGRTGARSRTTRHEESRELSPAGRALHGIEAGSWGMDRRGLAVGAGVGLTLAYVTADSLTCVGAPVCGSSKAFLFGAAIVTGSTVAGGWIATRLRDPATARSEPGVVFVGGLMSLTGVIAGSRALDAARGDMPGANEHAWDAGLLAVTGLATAGTGIALALTRPASGPSDDGPGVVVTPSLLPDATGLTVTGSL